MGKQAHEVIPIKFSHQNENLEGQIMNVLVGTMFIAFFYSIYKNRN